MYSYLLHATESSVLLTLSQCLNVTPQFYMCDIPDHMFLWDIPSLKQNEFECEYDFSIAVCKLYFITSHTSLTPGAPFSTGKQQERLRAV